MEDLYDPFDERVRVDPYPYYAMLRERAPVYPVAKSQMWAVSRYEDVLHVLKHPDLFSSDAMRTMLMSPRPGVDLLSDPESVQQMATLAAALPFPFEQLVTVRNLLALDPPDHAAMRNIVNRGFTSRSIAAWEPRIRELVDAALGKLRSQGSFDLIADLAIPLPVVIICEMLGVEPERRADFKRWSDTLVASSTGSARNLGLVEGGFAGVMVEFCEYFQRVIEDRKQHPKDDLISLLVRAQEGEHLLQPIDVVFFTLLLLVAGNETTTNLIGNAVNALFQHPEQMELVRDDRSLVPALVEETLRYDCPVQFVFRRAQRDVEINGTTVPSGSILVPLIGSANRDERQFERPDDFDVLRNTTGHLGFGFGIHFCLGAALARLEARVALEALVDELPRLERADAATQYIDSFLLRGIRKFELRLAA